jgi:MFS family permease
VSRLRAGAAHHATFFAVTLLAIEFLDEFVFGIREAAWPLIRTDLGLDYARIGLLFGVPGIASALVEPVLGILGDVWRRRLLVLGGGGVFALALLLTALSRHFPALLTAFIRLYPASRAFVTLSQATLMDADASCHEQTMARWTFAGSLGVVISPLALLKAQLCSAMPGQSGTLMTLTNVLGLVGGLIPLGLGLLAKQLGLASTMWLLLLGPIALLIGIPRDRKRSARVEVS